MKPFTLSKDSSFRSIQSSKMEIEEETVQAPLPQPKLIYRPVKIIQPPPQQAETIIAIVKKSCNCKKSQCLKQYCDCFANGQTCSENCNCVGCYNTSQNSKLRKQAKQIIKNRDPGAFKTTFKGCNCRKSGCQKKYCECFQNNQACTSLCRCDGCQNCDLVINK